MLRKGQILGALSEPRDEKGIEDNEETESEETDLLNADFEEQISGEFEIENEDN